MAQVESLSLIKHLIRSATYRTYSRSGFHATPESKKAATSSSTATIAPRPLVRESQTLY